MHIYLWSSSTAHGPLERLDPPNLVLNLRLEHLNLAGEEVSELTPEVPEVLKRLILLRVVQALHLSDLVADVEHLGLGVVGLQRHLFLCLFNVVVELLEGVGRGRLVLLDVRLETLEAVREVFDVRPRTVGLRSLDLLADSWLISEVCVVEVTVVTKEEGAEVEG